MDAYTGEIRAFGFSYVPENWLLCDGTQYAAQQFQQLFAIIGNLYGGDGRTTFKVPNLINNAPMHGGTPDPRWHASGPLSPGNTLGQPSVSLSMANLAHSHTMYGGTATTEVGSPVGAVPSALSNGGRPYPSYQTGNAANAQLAAQLLGNAGVSNPTAHENRQPLLNVMFCICYQGIWPERS
ncbi:MAG TPA: tail fiber protein [Polyangiales bacterium]